jgi:hypothetical protein
LAEDAYAPTSPATSRTKRAFCSRQTRRAVSSIRTAHEIDQFNRTGRLRVAAPGDMLVWARQHELVAIEFRCLTRTHVEYGKRKAALRSRSHDAGDMRRGVEAQ